MGYRLSTTAEPGQELRRIVLEQLDEATAQLGRQQQSNRPRSKRIHDARKAIKKTRSALRLIRRAIPKEAYASAIATLRDVAQTLAPMRDADVMRSTAASLQTASAWKRAPDHRRKPPLTPLAAPLEDLKVAIAVWPWQDISASTIAKAFSETIRRLAKAFRATVETEDPHYELFHTLRKRAKDLRYQCLLLEPLWPAVFKAYSEAAEKLEQHLGEDHDLAVLLEHDPSIDKQEASERQRQLRHKANKLGRRLSAECPKAWKQRIVAWFHL